MRTFPQTSLLVYFMRSRQALLLMMMMMMMMVNVALLQLWDVTASTNDTQPLPQDQAKIIMRFIKHTVI